MDIVDKAKGLFQEGINKGKDLVNKTMGGQRSAQPTAPAQDVQNPVPDPGPSTAGASTETTDPGSTTTGAGAEAPVDPTSEV